MKLSDTVRSIRQLQQLLEPKGSQESYDVTTQASMRGQVLLSGDVTAELAPLGSNKGSCKLSCSHNRKWELTLPEAEIRLFDQSNKPA